MSWGLACRKCGHPASYHGMTFCQVQAGGEQKKPCDCDGYVSLLPEPVKAGYVEGVDAYPLPAPTTERAGDDYDSKHSALPNCGYVGENQHGFVEACIRRAGHPGDHVGLGSE